MNKKKKILKIIVLIIIAVFLGTMIFYLYNLTNTKKDFSEKESDASEVIDTDVLKVIIKPDQSLNQKVLNFQNIAQKQRLVFLTVEVDNLSQAKSVSISGIGQNAAKDLNVFGKARIPNISIHGTYKKRINMPILYENRVIAVIGNAMQNDDYLKNYRSKGIRLVSGGSVNPTTFSSIIASRATAAKEMKNGTLICGIDGIYYDELLLRSTHSTDIGGGGCSWGDEDKNCREDYAVAIIISANKTIESSAQSAGCISITKVGFVEWDISFKEAVLAKLKTIHQSNNQNAPYTEVAFIENEIYPSPWGVVPNNYNELSTELKRLKTTYGIENVGLWFMDPYVALGFYDQNLDYVVFADIGGTWLESPGMPITDSKFPDLFDRNYVYAPCQTTSNTQSCYPYSSTAQMLIGKIKTYASLNKNIGYATFILGGDTLTNGTVKVEIKNSSGSVIKSTDIVINGGNVVTNSTCVRNCSGKQCGDDGCGGDCGVCLDHDFMCNSKNVCVHESCIEQGKECGANCGACDAGYSCNDAGQCVETGGVCTPSCDGKQCGDDTCGGSCGTCTGGKTCNNVGQCVDSQATIDIDIDGVAGVSMGDYSAFVLDYLAFRRRGEFNERSDFVKSTPNVIDMADYQAFVLEYLRLRRL